VKGSLQKAEAGDSQRAHQHEAWDPDWIKTRFVVLFRCTNDKCGEVVTCSGDSEVSEEYSNDPDGKEVREWLDIFTPSHFYPPLRFFNLPAECPEEVIHHLDRAFATAWSDTASTANAMRTALEAILTERSIPRTSINKKRKRVPLSLHHRIEKYVAKDTENSDLLLALKWLGNEGSHAHGEPSGITELLEGFRVFEHVIEHIYVNRAKAVRKLAKAIVQRKGKPRSAVRRASP
jgi:hypothetical protein